LELLHHQATAGTFSRRCFCGVIDLMKQLNSEFVSGHPPHLWNSHRASIAFIAIEENSFAQPNGSQRNHAIRTIGHRNQKLV
jgi:hypothetical protein